MAEGGGGAVEGDAQRLGGDLIQQLVHNVQKSENRVGGLALPSRQILADPVEGAVDNGITVDHHQFFHGGSLPQL